MCRARGSCIHPGWGVVLEIPKMFYACGRQLNIFMSVGILLQYFRRKLLLWLEWSKTVSNSVMSHSISLSKLIFYKSSPLFSSKFHVCWRLTAFPLRSKKTSWISLDIAAFQGFKVSLLLPHAYEDFACRLSRLKSKKKNYWNFEFRLNNKQPLMFHQGSTSLCL